MKISDLCESERPREKLMAQGAASLNKAELLAILINSGTRQSSALDLAHILLSKSDGSLMKLSEMSLDELCLTEGIKSGKAVWIMAALELGRRFVAESSYIKKEAITGPGRIYEMMIPHLKGLKHEECWILLLNSARYPIGKIRMTSGGMNSTTIDVKEIVRTALMRNAQALVLVHNHPSGNPRPGKADMEQTRSLRTAAEAMELSLIDHVIICDSSYFSFADDRVISI